jgi:hypothetical protein
MKETMDALMVASEMGVLILPKSTAELGIKDIAVWPLAGRWPQSELGLATLRSAADCWKR